MNGPSCMYSVHPFNKFKEDIEVPTCMYRMKNIQTSVAFSEPLACTSISSHTNFNDNTRPRSILEQNPLPQIVNLEGRQEAVLAQLEQLKQQMSLIKDLLKGNQQEVISTKHESDSTQKSFTQFDVVVNASPHYPPYAVLALTNACAQSTRPRVTCHVHSSVQTVPKELSSVFQSSEDCPTQLSKNSVITLIWKNVGRDAELILSPSSNIKIKGEVNILRFLSQLTPQFDASGKSIMKTTATDAILDVCHLLLWSSSIKQRQSLIRTLNANLKNGPFLMGESVSLADIAAWSVLTQLGVTQELTVNMSKWYQNCSDIFRITI